MSEVVVETVKTEETKENGIKYLNINVSNNEVERNPDIVRLCADSGILEYVKPKTGWIPVSEKLPEDGEWAIFTDGNLMSIERYKMDALDHFYPEGRYFDLEDVVAWMPLPERYKAESED